MAKASGSIDLKPVKAAHDDATKYITKIDDAGITVHPYNDTTGAVVTKDRAVITSGGMEIYKDDNSVAFFGETARIGKASGASRVLIDFNSFRQVDKEGSAYVKFADLRDASGIATINNDVLEARYFGQGDRMYVGNVLIYELLSLTADGEDVLADATVVDGRVQINPLPAIDAVVIASYTTKDRMMKAFTFGDRVTSEIGALSFSTGTSNTATGYAAHAEGSFNGANGECAHSEGKSTLASNDCAHSEGRSTTASGAQSHAEGRFTIAGGWASHAGGSHTIARRYAQTAIGEYNVEETGNETYRGNYVVIIGNGEDEENRSNALTVDWQGNVEAAGEIEGATSKTVITTFSSGWDVYDADSPITLRRCGKFVELTGWMKNTTAVTLSATRVPIFTIPEGYRPSQTMAILSQGSSMNVFVVRIADSGVVEFERYRSTNSTATSYSSINAGAWFPIHATWIMD